MIFLEYNCKCKKCSAEFCSSGLLEQSYGEFILRSKTGKEAYLMAINDKVYKDFFDMVGQFDKINQLDTFAQVKAKQKLFSITCDPAPDNSIYEIDGLRICPNCESTDVNVYGPANSPKLYKNHIESIEHTRWNLLTVQEKNTLTAVAVLKMDLKILED